MLGFPLPPHFSGAYLGCNILILTQFMVKSSCSWSVGCSTKATPDAVCSRNAVAARESLAQQCRAPSNTFLNCTFFWVNGDLSEL